MNNFNVTNDINDVPEVNDGKLDVTNQIDIDFQLALASHVYEDIKRKSDIDLVKVDNLRNCLDNSGLLGEIKIKNNGVWAYILLFQENNGTEAIIDIHFNSDMTICHTKLILSGTFLDDLKITCGQYNLLHDEEKKEVLINGYFCPQNHQVFTKHSNNNDEKKCENNCNIYQCIDECDECDECKKSNIIQCSDGHILCRYCAKRNICNNCRIAARTTIELCNICNEYVTLDNKFSKHYITTNCENKCPGICNNCSDNLQTITTPEKCTVCTAQINIGGKPICPFCKCDTLKINKKINPIKFPSLPSILKSPEIITIHRLWNQLFYYGKNDGINNIRNLAFFLEMINGI